MSIPESWHLVKIVDLLTLNENGKPFQQGWSPQCESYPAADDEWGVLKTTAIQQGEFWEYENKKLPSNLSAKTHLEVKPGDVLMTCAGPRNRCGIVCFIKSTRSKLLMSGKMYRFRPNLKTLIPQYLEAFITSHAAQKLIDEMKTGINDSGLNLTHGRFSELNVPLAPLNEQRRIVTKIEALFTELDQGIENLKTAQAQLEVYRQALLKHAFEGKLTAEWRTQNADKLESASALQQRIQNAREQRYQQQLAEWEANKKAGRKQGSKPNAPKPMTPLNVEELAELPKLPEGWQWAKLDHLGELYCGQSPSIAEVNAEGKGMLYVTGPEQWNGSEIEASKWTEFPKRIVPDGCIFITVKGAGVGKLFPGVQCAIGRDIYAYAPDKLVNFNYVINALKHGIDMVIMKAQGDIPGLSKSHILDHVIGLPSIAEQVQITLELETRFSVIEQLNQNILSSLKQAEALRQSILKKAFSGELVPQDPYNEPAVVLLTRIKAEKN